VIEVGLYRALVELKIPIHAIFGTSIGAINGAFIAAGFTPDEMTRLWLKFQKERLFTFDRRLFLFRTSKMDGLYRTDRFQRFLGEALPVRRFEELTIPLTVTATNLQTGEPVYLNRGEILPAILASSAIPPYFPPVEYQGYRLADGALVDNVPIGVAVEQSATRIFALLCHCAQELQQPTQGVLDITARAFRIAMAQRFRHDLEHYKDRAELILLEPCFDFPPSLLKLELKGVQPLIEQAYQFTMAKLTRRGFVPASTPSKDMRRGVN